MYKRQGKDSLTGLHANTQIPKIIGAAEIYEQNPEKYADYKKACENFWNYVVNNRSYAIGGNSIAEHFEAEGAAVSYTHLDVYKRQYHDC